MPNGECAVGARNAADIKNLQKDRDVHSSAIEKVNSKLDSINTWLLVTLGGVVVTLALQLFTIATKGVAK